MATNGGVGTVTTLRGNGGAGPNPSWVPLISCTVSRAASPDRPPHRHVHSPTCTAPDALGTRRVRIPLEIAGTTGLTDIYAEAVVEEAPVDVDPVLLAQPSAGWLRLFRVSADSPHDPRNRGWQPLIAVPLSESMLQALLAAAEHRAKELPDRPVAPARPRAVNVVLDVIEAHPEQEYTIGTLAQLAGIGVRALQKGFQQHVGMSPMSYLRQVRLARVHDELRKGEARTVAEAAHRWGFTHLGRFAAAYAARYGVTPSLTLRSGQ